PHLHHSFSPYGPPPVALFPDINQALLERARDREGCYARWAVGTPYENRETATVRLRFGRSLGLPAARLLRYSPRQPADASIRRGVLGVAGATAGVTGLGLGAGVLIAGPEGLLLAAGGGLGTGALGS